MRVVALAIGLAILPVAVSAQQAPDPVQSLSTEWSAMMTAQGHVAGKLGDLVTAYQQQQAAYEARLATAMEWLKAAQAKTK
jgi:hypothetical protein